MPGFRKRLVTPPLPSDDDDTNLVLHDDAQVLLLRGVVDQGGGGQVCVLVLQLTVQRCGNVCLYIASRLAIASILNITYRLKSTRSFDKRLLRKCCYHLDCSFYKKSKAFPRLLWHLPSPHLSLLLLSSGINSYTCDHFLVPKFLFTASQNRQNYSSMIVQIGNN